MRAARSDDASGCRTDFFVVCRRAECLPKLPFARRPPMCYRRTPVAKDAAPAASRRRFPARFRACRTASRPACAACSSATICAAGSSAGPSGPRAVRGCSRRPRCAAHRATRRSRGSRSSKPRRSLWPLAPVAACDASVRRQALAARDCGGPAHGTGVRCRRTNSGRRRAHRSVPSAAAGFVRYRNRRASA